MGTMIYLVIGVVILVYALSQSDVRQTIADSPNGKNMNDSTFFAMLLLSSMLFVVFWLPIILAEIFKVR